MQTTVHAYAISLQPGSFLSFERRPLYRDMGSVMCLVSTVACLLVACHAL